MKYLMFEKLDSIVKFDVFGGRVVGILKTGTCHRCLEEKPVFVIANFSTTICKECLLEMFEISLAHFEPGPHRPPEEGRPA